MPADHVCGKSLPSSQCPTCMAHLERVMDRAEAKAAAQAAYERRLSRRAARAVRAVRYRVERIVRRIGRRIACRHGWHLAKATEPWCRFCSFDYRVKR